MWKCEDVEMWKYGDVLRVEALQLSLRLQLLKSEGGVKILAPGVKLLKDLPQDGRAFVNKPYPDRIRLER